MNGLEVVTLGGGCFWCLEAVYDQMRGITDVVSGYAGGHVINPSYKAVCTGTTGHAEVTQVTFDTNEVSLKEILQVFFTIHDPTTLNRQGNDVGPQYRSAIFYHNEAQKQVAEEVIREFEAEQVWDSPIVTEISPLDIFYPAEDYHQEYYENNQYQPYCMFVVAPKVKKFRQKFTQQLKR